MCEPKKEKVNFECGGCGRDSWDLFENILGYSKYLCEKCRKEFDDDKKGIYYKLCRKRPEYKSIDCEGCDCIRKLSDFIQKIPNGYLELIDKINSTISYIPKEIEEITLRGGMKLNLKEMIQIMGTGSKILGIILSQDESVYLYLKPKKGDTDGKIDS